MVAAGVFAFGLYWIAGRQSARHVALEQREYTGHPPVRVDAATDDRRAVAARTDGSLRAASDQDRAMTRLMSRNATYRGREAEVTETHTCRMDAMGKALIK